VKGTIHYLDGAFHLSIVHSDEVQFHYF